MTINLNSLEYKNKPLLSKEALLEYFDEVKYFSAYLDGQNFTLGKPILSPIREEKNPSFGFFTSPDSWFKGEILFKDFGTGITGDFIHLVRLKYGLTYYEALSKIAIDFGLESDFYCKKIDNNKIKSANIVSVNKKDVLQKSISFYTLKVKTRDWQLHDIKFWKDFGISKNTLLKYNVFPLDYIFLYYKQDSDKIIKTDKYSYCFLENKDDVQTYKIYQPFNKRYKWLTNHDVSVWQGWNQLPETGEQLIITKSLKDVMSITENLNIPAVALQNESCKPKESVIKELKDRFTKLYLFYDNDFDKEINWGQMFAIDLINTFELENILIPDEYKVKDFTDCVKQYGIDMSKEIYTEMTHNILPF